jgi:hypothetical protein
MKRIIILLIFLALAHSAYRGISITPDISDNITNIIENSLIVDHRNIMNNAVRVS